MFRSRAVIKTTNAGKYPVQLSKHWNHNFNFTYTQEEAHIPFSETIHLDIFADSTRQQYRLKHRQKEDANRMENVFVDHIEHFAFREPLDIEWQRETLS